MPDARINGLHGPDYLQVLEPGTDRPQSHMLLGWCGHFEPFGSGLRLLGSLAFRLRAGGTSGQQQQRENNRKTLHGRGPPTACSSSTEALAAPGGRCFQYQKRGSGNASCGMVGQSEIRPATTAFSLVLSCPHVSLVPVP